MTFVDAVILVVFGVPLAVGCSVLLFGMLWLQIREDQLLAEKRGTSDRR